MIESILFFGTRCAFADHVLETLSERGFTIAARLLPGHVPGVRPFQELTPQVITSTGRRLPMADTAASGQADQSFPTVAISHHQSEEVVDYLLSLKADLAVVCCYPRRLPMELINSARLGGLNIHPSLLPAYRGPEPLFWSYRNGERVSGVTVHRVAASLDSGPILAQQRIDVPIGMPGDDLWMHSAKAGAELLLSEVLRDRNGLPSGTTQPDHLGSYYSWPRHEDLIIDLDQWDAWRVFHFCKGVIPLGYTPRALISRSAWIVKSAHEYVNEANTGPFDQAHRALTRWFSCANGAVKLTLGEN